MFDDPAPRRSPLPWLLGLGGLALLGGLGWAVAGGHLDVVLAGGNPLAARFVDARVDQPYAESPLAVALRLDEADDADGILAWADALAAELGSWLLAHTGAADLQAAERALWDAGSPDPFAVKWAAALRDRGVVSRRNRRLAEGVERSPLVVHPDDLALIWAHVAWRLDLRTELVRSPVHLYVLWREPGGDGVRGVEPTCFRRVDALGALVPSEEPSVGRRLTFPETHYPSGAGGIPAPPSPLPGQYTAVADAELESELAARRARVRWDGAIHRGLVAWEQGDADALADAAAEADALHATHGDALRAAPDHLVLAAAARGDRDGLGPVFAHYEPRGPVELARSPAHAVAMWLDLEHRAVRHPDWNGRLVPLFNRYERDPERHDQLCAWGRQALATVEQTLAELMPSCVE